MSVLPLIRISNPKRGRGFTLVELLVVISIIAVIASLILPALARARARAQGGFCLNNTRQLVVAWMLYADDHNGVLAYNLGGNARGTVALPSTAPGPAMSDNWVNNVENWELSSDNTNSSTLVGTGLGPYANKATAVYKCPSDNVLSDAQRAAGWNGRVRSYSMNALVGDAGAFSVGGVNANATNYVQFFKVFNIPHPTDIFVFLDEHPDSIDDGYFLNQETDGAQQVWTDLPASYHDGAASFSFADGHSELHRWHNGSTLQPSRAYGISPALPMPITDGLQDFSWVMSRMSVERSSGWGSGSGSGYGSSGGGTN
jgi:prepilin-type N-terminal cleavage/methylation domain-containing protein/prepilin-type processing-associated H-X9-DG protein